MKIESFPGHHEAREAFSAFSRGRDRSHADRELGFADLVLRSLPQTAKPPAMRKPTALPFPHTM
jgi:hypothetical protein